MNHIFSLKLWSVAAIFLFIFCINARPSTAPPGWDIGMPGEGTVTSEEWEVIATQECGIVTSSSEDYPEAEITPEISCMAHSLDNDPVRIFQFVRNHIKYVPSFGSRQGATATLLTEQGNDLDQASLLLALLSSADPSTDAHYVSASVKYSKTFLSKLLGFNANKTFEVFSDFGIPSSNAGSSVWVTRFWIETTINGTNYILDPAFVQCQWSASVDLSGPMDYDRSDFIASAMTGAQIDSSGGTWIKDVNESNIRSELATLRGNLLSHIRTNYPNARVEDLLGIPEIIPENYTNLPTALSYAQETGTKTSYTGGLLATHYASLRIQHCNIDYTLYASELAGKRMSIFYTGSGNAPQLRLNGELLQTGYGTTNGVGYTITLTVSVPPFQTGDTRSHSRLQKSGFKYVISSDFGAATPELIKQAGHRLGKYREAGMANTSEAVMGESLNLLGLRWLVQIKQQSSMANKATSVFGSKKYAAGFVSQEEGFGVDYPLSRGVAVAQSGANADIIAWLKTTSLMNSALEHGIIEQTSGDVSASSVKMLKLGNSAGDETYYTDDSNWDTIKNLISWYSSSTLSAIEYYVSVGATVILPKHGNRGVGDDWNGVGYIAEGYSWIASLLSGNYSGGASGNQGNIDSTDIQNMISGMEVSILDGLNTRTTAADPVDLTTGAFVHEHVDLALGKTPPKGLNFRRIYSSDARLSEGIMGYGWRHNLDISAKIISESGPIAGTRLPVDFVVGYVASLVRADILKNEQNVKGWMITTLVAQWHMDMMTRNTACFQLPDKTLKFIAMGDGTYSAPPGVTAELSKPNGLYRLTERSGREYRFNNNMLIDSIVDADGNTMSFAYNSQTNLQTVTDSYGRTLTFTYTGERLKKVTDSTGREVVLWYYSPYDNLNFYDDPDGNRWEYKYDDDHQLISMIDPLSQTIISNIYNSVGQVVTQYNNSGEAWEFLVNGYDGIENRPDNGRTTHTFDKNGWVLSIEDAHDNLTQKSYDGQGHLVTNIDANGNTTVLQYDADHNMTNRIDALSNSWSYVYNNDHHPITSTDPLGNSTHFGYDANHHLTNAVDALANTNRITYYTSGSNKGLVHTVTDSRSNVTTYVYDSYGNPEEITRTDGGTTTNIWNSIGDLLSTTDPNGRTTSFTYNKRRLITSVTDPLGNTVSNIYNAAGHKTETIDKRGNSILYTHTPTYKISTITYPDGGTTSNTYDSADRLIEITDARSNTTVFAYDKAGRRVSIEDALGNATHYTLDSNGNILATTNALAHVTHNALDALNRVTNSWDIVDTQTRSVEAEFDTAGRKTAAINQLDQRTEYDHDEVGRITTTTRPDGLEEHNSYDALGNLLSYTNAKGKAIVRTTYDGQSRPTSQTNALDNGKSWTYDSAGNQLTRTDANGDTTDYTFDELNRISTVEYPDDTAAGFTYDENSNLLTATNTDTALSFAYDTMNRITVVTQSLISVHQCSSVVNYSHDLNGNRTSITYPDSKTVAYTYDAANRLTGIDLSDFSISSFSFSYDDANRITGITYPNGVTATYTRDTAGRITDLEYTKSGNSFIDRTYEYNALGQITKRTIDAGLEATPPDTHQHMRHNAADQLTHVSRMDNYEHPERWRDVGSDFDANGAVTNINIGYQSMNSQNEFAWDYDGQLTSYNGEHQTNLWFTAPPLPVNLNWEYDALGGRISRKESSDETIHVLDQAATLKNVLVQCATNGTIERYYIYAPGFGLVAHIDTTLGSTPYALRFYHGDHLGSTIALTDEDGDVTDEFAYTPYGELMSRTGDTETPYTFCGRHGAYWEGGALYHMKHRYYRADLCRFISSDPIGISGGINLYLYANGDPIRFLDALGLCANSGYQVNPGDSWGTRTGEAAAYIFDGFGHQVAETLKREGQAELDRILRVFEGSYIGGGAGGKVSVTFAGVLKPEVSAYSIDTYVITSQGINLEHKESVKVTSSLPFVPEFNENGIEFGSSPEMFGLSTSDLNTWGADVIIPSPSGASVGLGIQIHINEIFSRPYRNQ